MAAENPIQRQPAKDRTVYWTLSFYIPVGSANFAPAIPARSDEFANWLRGSGRGGNRSAAAGCVDDETRLLRQSIDPLFNDIADRSRLGKVDDFLFAGQKARDVTLTLPRQIEWMTEGKAFVVPLPDDQRDRSFDFRSFWYVHGNGSLSWHAGFSHWYKDHLTRELEGGIPATYYLLSLLQKLAWPKEFDPAAANVCGDDDCTTDALIKIAIDGTPFWQFLKAQFDKDASGLLPRLYGPFGWTVPRLASDETLFDRLIETAESIEVPGLHCPISRSSFFINDKPFFDLIQPKRDGVLIGRGSRVLDDNFIDYPRLIEDAQAVGGKVHLDARYWQNVHSEDAGASKGAGDATVDDAKTPASGLPDAAERMTYLFLAGFNQNIIDFMNQEASEVLDSLDPIYPKSDEQEAEGFFIRYANPRSMITYVPRSRTLEVGNDFIGTCPYAFLIHALSMHNEVLTRMQEKATFIAIREVMDRIDAARQGDAVATPSAKSASADALRAAEALINTTRIDAFGKFDQHRYANPFRYDTERDVFEAMERLRGTSRLKDAYKAALDALDDQARDIQHIRKESEEEAIASRERRMSYIFSFLGFTGITGLILATDDFLRKHVAWPFKTFRPFDDLTLISGYWIVPAVVIFLIIWRTVASKK